MFSAIVGKKEMRQSGECLCTSTYSPHLWLGDIINRMQNIMVETGFVKRKFARVQNVQRIMLNFRLRKPTQLLAWLHKDLKKHNGNPCSHPKKASLVFVFSDINYTMTRQYSWVKG